MRHVRRPPPRTDSSRMSIRCTFDYGPNALPVLGDLVREKRGKASRFAAGQEADVGGHVIMAIENHRSAKADEIEKLLAWVGYTALNCQTPPPIAHRNVGRPRLDGANVAPILEDILAWLASGKTLPKYENLKYQVSSKAAKDLVTRYMRTSPEFRGAFKQALAIGAHHLVAETLDIADDPTITPAQAATRIKARQWAAERYNVDDFGKTSESNVNLNIGFGDALQALERRRGARELAPPSERVIDVEPIQLERADERVSVSGRLASD